MLMNMTKWQEWMVVSGSALLTLGSLGANCLVAALPRLAEAP